MGLAHTSARPARSLGARPDARLHVDRSGPPCEGRDRSSEPFVRTTHMMPLMAGDSSTAERGMEIAIWVSS